MVRKRVDVFSYSSNLFKLLSFNSVSVGSGTKLLAAVHFCTSVTGTNSNGELLGPKHPETLSQNSQGLPMLYCYIYLYNSVIFSPYSKQSRSLGVSSKNSKESWTNLSEHHRIALFDSAQLTVLEQLQLLRNESQRGKERKVTVRYSEDRQP